MKSIKILTNYLFRKISPHFHFLKIKGHFVTMIFLFGQVSISYHQSMLNRYWDAR